MKPVLLVVHGPTASGKTDVAIQLAQHFQAEILSADSRQFYKELNIGVAKPTKEQLQAATHHFVDFLSIHEEYSAGHFERDAIGFLERYYQKHHMAILAGGSGLFIKAVTTGFDDFPEVPDSLRAELQNRLNDEGLDALVEELKRLDPEYTQIALDNPRRVLRALEICHVSGKPFSSFKVKTAANRPFRVVHVALNWNRETLYERINARCDEMLEQGLFEEVKSLLPFKHLNACQTVGYQEFFHHLDGNCSYEEAVAKFKQHTRNYAKRQVTWLKKIPDITWFQAPVQVEQIISHVNSVS